MRHAIATVVMGLAIALAGAARAEWYEPARGTPERRAIMDAIRPEAEALFGPPVEFVISKLRVSGDQAFVIVGAQRPGGGAIDLAQTPGGRAGRFDYDADHTGGYGFVQRVGGRWVPADFGFGATDVWWQDARTCAVWRAVIPDYCVGY